jgi:hypothetical protein
MTGIETIGSLAAMWLVGYGQKKALQKVGPDSIDFHRPAGISTNVLLGQGASVALGGTPADGMELTIYAEAGVNGIKGAIHAGKALWSIVQKLRGG